MVCIISFVYSDRNLLVKVHGPRPENILFLIHEVLESLITESFHGVKYDYRIPCPDCIAKSVCLIAITLWSFSFPISFWFNILLLFFFMKLVFILIRFVLELKATIASHRAKSSHQLWQMSWFYQELNGPFLVLFCQPWNIFIWYMMMYHLFSDRGRMIRTCSRRQTSVKLLNTARPFFSAGNSTTSFQCQCYKVKIILRKDPRFNRNFFCKDPLKHLFTAIW